MPAQHKCLVSSMAASSTAPSALYYRVSTAQAALSSTCAMQKTAAWLFTSCSNGPCGFTSATLTSSWQERLANPFRTTITETGIDSLQDGEIFFTIKRCWVATHSCLHFILSIVCVFLYNKKMNLLSCLSGISVAYVFAATAYLGNFYCFVYIHMQQGSH